MNKGFDIFILSNKNKVKIEVVTKLKKKVKLLFNKYLLVLFKTETFIFTLFQNVAQNSCSAAGQTQGHSWRVICSYSAD